MLYLIRSSTSRLSRDGYLIVASDREDALRKAGQLVELGITDLEIVDRSRRSFTLAEFERQAGRAKELA